MTAVTTRQLTAAPLQLVSDARARTLMRAALVAVLVAVAAAAGLRWIAAGAASVERQSALADENGGLRGEIARLEAELELERATHAALDQQVEELNQRLVEADRQLAFVQAQDRGTRRMAATN